jgi:hypothetical protein
MDSAYLSAFLGLAGVAIGALTTFITSWLTQRAQHRQQHREREIAKREALFGEFITEASRLFGDALSHEKDDVTDLIKLYALVGQMRLVSSNPVIGAAERVMDTIVDTYLGPNFNLHELHALARKGGMNFLSEFGEACRAELAQLLRITL